jgi:methyl-accepting chemotaxis protein
MTPEQITLVQTSYQRLGPRLPDMAARFYQELFRRNPALRSLFTIDLAEQQVRFARKLTELVEAMPRLDELLAHTRALGARHVGYGVRAADYQTVGAALVDALAAVLGDGFDSETRQAWVLAYNLMAETMLDGAASARPVS